MHKDQILSILREAERIIVDASWDEDFVQDLDTMLEEIIEEIFHERARKVIERNRRIQMIFILSTGRDLIRDLEHLAPRVSPSLEVE